jgi:hypothetical protein
MDERRPPDQVTFTPDFASAKRADGSEIVFTRSEAGILRCLAERPGRIVTRNQLLDAISGEGSSKSDRNIDYVVSRIRRKLGDDPATPRFILTRYGEGYRWLAGGQAEEQLEADLVVGPLRGLDGIGELASCARRFAGAVFDAMKRERPPCSVPNRVDRSPRDPRSASRSRSSSTRTGSSASSRRVTPPPMPSTRSRGGRSPIP